MSDDEFVSADSGAAGTTPIRVGELKKGMMVMIKGHACKIVDYSTAKTGKHGSAKAMCAWPPPPRTSRTSPTGRIQEWMGLAVLSPIPRNGGAGVEKDRA